MYVFQPSMQSMTGVYDVRPPIARCVVSCVLPSLLFAVLSLQVRPRTIKPLSTFDFVHMRKKYQALHPPLHNFNVRILEHGSLGMRLVNMQALSLTPRPPPIVCSLGVVYRREGGRAAEGLGTFVT